LIIALVHTWPCSGSWPDSMPEEHQSAVDRKKITTVKSQKDTPPPSHTNDNLH